MLLKIIWELLVYARILQNIVLTESLGKEKEKEETIYLLLYYSTVRTEDLFLLKMTRKYER